MRSSRYERRWKKNCRIRGKIKFIQELYNIIEKSPEIRDAADNLKIFRFLNETFLAVKLRNERIVEGSIMNMMAFISSDIQLLFKRKEEVLFHEGNWIF